MGDEDEATGLLGTPKPQPDEWLLLKGPPDASEANPNPIRAVSSPARTTASPARATAAPASSAAAQALLAGVMLGVAEKYGDKRLLGAGQHLKARLAGKLDTAKTTTKQSKRKGKGRGRRDRRR